MLEDRSARRQVAELGDWQSLRTNLQLLAHTASSGARRHAGRVDEAAAP
jgi:hypothetical protein